MTNPLMKRIAGGISVVEALWVFYTAIAGTFSNTPYVSCMEPCAMVSLNPLVVESMLVVGVLLLIAGALGLWGAWFAFPAGLVLSLALLASTGYVYWLFSGYAGLQSQAIQALIGAVVAGIGAVANLLAMRARSVVPEEANPMNLPVFG